jgi:hypothetical protein
VAFERRVTGSIKLHGTIVALCNEGEPWSPRAAADVIRDIETGAHAYFAEVDGRRVWIHVVHDRGSRYLRTNPDGVEPNNLDVLPDC